MNNYSIYNKCGIKLLSEMENNSVEIILSDIPYNECNRPGGGLRNLDKGKADVITFPLEEGIRESARVARGHIYIFCGVKQISAIAEILEEYKATVRLGQWEKTNPSPMNGDKMWLSGSEFCVIGRKKNAKFNEHCQKPIWKYPVGRNKFHPTQKPIALMKRIIESSTDIGDAVLDFTMGSGSTGVASLECGRNFIGAEIDENFFKVAEERMGNIIYSPSLV